MDLPLLGFPGLGSRFHRPVGINRPAGSGPMALRTGAPGLGAGTGTRTAGRARFGPSHGSARGLAPSESPAAGPGLLLHRHRQLRCGIFYAQHSTSMVRTELWHADLADHSPAVAGAVWAIAQWVEFR